MLKPAGNPRARLIGRALLAAIGLGLSSPSPGWAQARTPLVQSVDVQVPAPPTPVRIAGRPHLAYELHVTNFRSVDVVLTRVEILDAGLQAPLGDLRDSDLQKTLGRPGSGPDLADKRVIGPGLRAVVFLWLALDEAAPIPRKLRHRIELELVRPSGREPGVVDEPGVEVRPEAPLVLEPPLRGGPWVALYDPKMAGGHRTSIYTVGGRARIPARFAVDWIKLDRDASHARGDESRIANWHGYAAEVLAVADGVVADARDDIPEAPSIGGATSPVALENASGNYVALDLGAGRYAFYEHLKHGSLKVRTGDRVRSGQVLGLLGNSGSSSSGPHLHFHVADASSTLAAEGVPYVFRSFDVLGAFGTIGAFASGEPWGAAPKAAGGHRSSELPAANVVVLFGSAERESLPSTR